MSFQSSLDSILFLIGKSPKPSRSAPRAAKPRTRGGRFMGMLPFSWPSSHHVFPHDPAPAKADRERRDMLDALAKGDEVVTVGGICGKSGIGCDVVLRVDDEVRSNSSAVPFRM